jgi:hypothetical protein
VGDFAAGFSGKTWDKRAEEAIGEHLELFHETPWLSEVDKQRLTPRIEELLKTERNFLRSERAVEAVANRLTAILCLCAVIVPAVVVGQTTPTGEGSVWSYFIGLFGVAAVVIVPPAVLEKLTGRYRAGLVWMALVLWAYIVTAAWIVVQPGPTNPDDRIQVAAVSAVTALAILLVGRLYLVAWNHSALTNAWAEQRLEAAVVWKLLLVIAILVAEPDKDGTPTLLQRSGMARAFLAEAAKAVTDYLPRLIEGGRSNAQTIASRGAAFLLDLTSAVNLPNGQVSEDDFGRLTDAVEKWSIGSLADMPQMSPPPADSLESPSRRSRAFQVLRKLLLGVLPLILLIAGTLLPLKMPADITAALAPFAVTWLLLSIASVLAPADVKMDTKALFNL